MCDDTFASFFFTSNKPFTDFISQLRTETFTFTFHFIFCFCFFLFKFTVDYDSENGDDDTGDVEGAGADRDENQIEQRHDAVSTTKNPLPNENEISSENVAVDSRNGLIESNNEDIVGSQRESVHYTDITAPIATADVVVDCTVNNGGCEQNCAVIQNELTGQLVIECSCGESFALDIDNTHCIGEYDE